MGEFPIKNAQKGPYRSYCRNCCREYGREHYRKYPEVYARKAKAQAAVDRARNRRIVADHLATHPCVDCRERDPIVLEFDHREPSAKADDVGRVVHAGSGAALQAEIDKCDVRCGNCHRIKTARQFGSYRIGGRRSASKQYGWAKSLGLPGFSRSTDNE
ncbi:MAG: hypothetical protein NVS9B6_14180 [Candidatus Limnocylindrales bacterium]